MLTDTGVLVPNAIGCSIHTILQTRDHDMIRLADTQPFFVDWFENAIDVLGKVSEWDYKRIIGELDIPDDDYSIEFMLMDAMCSIGKYANKDYSRKFEIGKLYSICEVYISSMTDEDRFIYFLRKYWTHQLAKRDEFLHIYANEEASPEYDTATDAYVYQKMISDDHRAFVDYIDLKALYYYGTPSCPDEWSEIGVCA